MGWRPETLPYLLIYGNMVPSPLGGMETAIQALPLPPIFPVLSPPRGMETLHTLGDVSLWSRIPSPLRGMAMRFLYLCSILPSVLCFEPTVWDGDSLRASLLRESTLSLQGSKPTGWDGDRFSPPRNSFRKFRSEPTVWDGSGANRTK